MEISQYQIRSEIYNKTEIMGVRDNDFKWVLIATVAALSIPFGLELFIGPIPVSVITTPIALVGTLMFFNWARVGKRANFLEFKLKNLKRVKLHKRWRSIDLQKNCRRYLES